MAIEGFDYKQFSTDLATQAKELVPQDFEPFQKGPPHNFLMFL